MAEDRVCGIRIQIKKTQKDSPDHIRKKFLNEAKISMDRGDSLRIVSADSGADPRSHSLYRRGRGTRSLFEMHYLPRLRYAEMVDLFREKSQSQALQEIRPWEKCHH